MYRIPLNVNPETLDPALFTGVDAEGVARRIFDTLVELDADLRPAPGLAESWTVSDDRRAYTFALRAGVRFHNGRPMTAEDVRYSFERLLRPATESHRASIVEPILGGRAMREGKADSLSGLETPDARTVRLALAAPDPLFLCRLAMTNAAIVPREEIEKAGLPFGRRPVGTGPFRFVSWRDNDRIELARNEDYYRGAPALAGLRFRVIKEPMVAWQEYRSGNLEHCAVPEALLPTLGASPDLRSTPTLSTYYLGILMTRDALGANLHLRRAINHAVDRKFLCEKVLGGAHVPARGVLPPGLPGYNPDIEGYVHDPDAARRDLALAGYGPSGKTVPPLTLYCRNSPQARQAAQAIQSDLKRLGIEVSLRVLDFAALKEAVNRQEPDLFYMAWAADFPDAENFLRNFHSAHLGAAGNRARYVNPAVDALLDQAGREADPDARLELLRAAEQAVVADAPWVFLSHGRTHLMVQPYVRNFTLGPMDLGTSVNQVDFRKVGFSAE